MTGSNANAFASTFAIPTNLDTKAKIAKELASQRTKDSPLGGHSMTGKKHEPLNMVLPKCRLP